jgi:hypothetical protein
LVVVVCGCLAGSRLALPELGRASVVGGRLLSGTLLRVLSCSRLAASWLFSSRRKAHFLLEHCMAVLALPNVRAKRATTAGRQARAVQDKPRRRAGLVACRWRSA